jgi:hypothetical protein
VYGDIQGVKSCTDVPGIVADCAAKNGTVISYYGERTIDPVCGT